MLVSTNSTAVSERGFCYAIVESVRPLTDIVIPGPAPTSLQHSNGYIAINSSCSLACSDAAAAAAAVDAAINAQQIDVATWPCGLRTIQQADSDPQQSEMRD